MPHDVCCQQLHQNCKPYLHAIPPSLHWHCAPAVHHHKHQSETEDRSFPWPWRWSSRRRKDCAAVPDLPSRTSGCWLMWTCMMLISCQMCIACSDVAVWPYDMSEMQLQGFMSRGLGSCLIRQCHKSRKCTRLLFKCVKRSHYAGGMIFQDDTNLKVTMLKSSTTGRNVCILNISRQMANCRKWLIGRHAASTATVGWPHLISLNSSLSCSLTALRNWLMVSPFLTTTCRRWPVPSQ